MTAADGIQSNKDMLFDLFASYSNELQSKVARLDKIIDRSHWLSVGSYKESILKEMIYSKIPKRFEVGTGFVMSMKGRSKLLSRQIDILIWDSYNKSPIFRDGDFVIIPPEACRCAIEVKSTLTTKTINEAIENIDSLHQFIDHANAHTSIFKAVFGYQAGPSFRFPNSIHKALKKYYSNDPTQLAERVNWMTRHIGNQSLPWIDCIACLDQGIVSFIPCHIGDNHHASYHSKPISDHETNDTYGTMERQLIASLLVGSESYQMRMDNPGINQVYSYLRKENFQDSWSLIPGKDPSEIKNIGSYVEPFVSKALIHLFSQA